MLPGDSKARRVKKTEQLSQTLVEDHYEIQRPEDKPKPYSHELWREAAIQWLVETDQVCHKITHSLVPHSTNQIHHSLSRPLSILRIRR